MGISKRFKELSGIAVVGTALMGMAALAGNAVADMGKVKSPEASATSFGAKDLSNSASGSWDQDGGTVRLDSPTNTKIQANPSNTPLVVIPENRQQARIILSPTNRKI